VLLLLPESSLRTPARFDALGALGLGIGLMALLLAITEGATWGWTSALTLGCFGASVVVLLGWAVIELRTSAPLADLRVTARPQVLFTNLASIMVGFSLFGMSLVFIQLLMAPHATGYGLAQSMLGAGLELAPAGIVMMLLAPVSALISARRGPKVTLMVGGYRHQLRRDAGADSRRSSRNRDRRRQRYEFSHALDRHLHFSGGHGHRPRAHDDEAGTRDPTLDGGLPRGILDRPRRGRAGLPPRGGDPWPYPRRASELAPGC
jgi:hypothetical protein